jgi:hypothetical protein
METVSVDIPRELIYIFKIREKDLSKAVRESLAIEFYSIERGKYRWEKQQK